MAEGAISFATRLLELIHRGAQTSSYKHALLTALIELASEARGRGAVGSAVLTTRAIAARMLELYWPQTRDFPLGDRVIVLDQIGGGRRSLVHHVAVLRGLDDRLTSTPNRARLHFPAEYRQLLDEFEVRLIRYPLRLLQQLGNERVELLYEDWGREIAESVISQYQRQFADGAPSSDFDNRVILLPGVHVWLAELAPLFLPLIRREWATLVARRNRLPDSELEKFLFEPNREQLGELRPGLAALQGDRCFYCSEILEPTSTVDHFLAWARCGASSIENLVVAHARCNGDKSDYLVAARHLERWVLRLADRRDDLAELAAERRWQSEPGRIGALVRSNYIDLAAETRLWLARQTWRRAGDEPIQSVLEAWS